jgi:hypothetical protein
LPIHVAFFHGPARALIERLEDTTGYTWRLRIEEVQLTNSSEQSRGFVDLSEWPIHCFAI